MNYANQGLKVVDYLLFNPLRGCKYVPIANPELRTGLLLLMSVGHFFIRRLTDSTIIAASATRGY